MTSTKQPANTESMNPRWNWLFKLGSIASLILFALFVVGMTGISTTSGWFTSFQDNWLMVLFKLNIRFNGTQTGMLNVLNILDIVIMLLFGILFLSLNAALHRAHRTWSVIATSLPFLGLVLFLITHTAGRSGLLIGGLIFSAVMLGSKSFSKISAYVGIVASALLFFAGDIGTTVFPPSYIIAILIGIGYVLWVIWFFLIGRRLFQLANGKFQVA